MKNVDLIVKNAIRGSNEVSAVPRLTAEWNMNRYVGVTADNVAPEDTNAWDSEVFPIESIYANDRPVKGILKARIGESSAAIGYEDRNSPKYYIGSADDIYKYWTSPSQTNGSSVFPTYTDNLTIVRPYIVYAKVVNINKIVIKVDNFWATPASYSINIRTTVNGAWTNVINNPVIDNDGIISVYYNGTAWTSTRPANFATVTTTPVLGIQFQVNSMTSGRKRNGLISAYRTKSTTGTGYTVTNTSGQYSFLNLIEISGRLEADLSDRLIGVEDTSDLSDVSVLYPIGTLTSNDATLTLSNINESNGVTVNNYFNKNNTTTPFYGLIEQNVKFNLEYLYEINDVIYPVQQFKMYGGPWTGLSTEEVSIQLTDGSTVLQQLTPRPLLYEQLTVPEIVERLLNSVGYNNYVIDQSDLDENTTVSVFWVDGTMNTWEVLDDLARGTQCAIYFDAYGVLQIKTRNAAFKATAAPVWTARGNDSGNELADIIQLDQTDEVAVNSVIVTYKSMSWQPFQNDNPTLQSVWSPEGTVTLRSATLQRNLTDDTQYIYLTPDDARYWPFSGMVQIEGELIAYNGKAYIWYDDDGAAHSYIAKSIDDVKKYYAKTPAEYRHKCHYHGALYIPETDGDRDNSRGLWNTAKKDHVLDVSGYTIKRVNQKPGGDRVVRKNSAGMTWLKNESKVSLRNPTGALGSSAFQMIKNSGNAFGYYYYGTKFKFVKQAGMKHQIAGLLLHGNVSNENGYYIELSPTSTMTATTRKTRNELMFYSRRNGKFKAIGPATGAIVPVVEGIDTELDVWYQPVSGGHRFIIMINGTEFMDATVTGDDMIDWSGVFGMSIRGATKAEFEYLYGVNQQQAEPSDGTTFLNLKQGGFTGAQWDREWVWQWRTAIRKVKKKSTKIKAKYNIYFFDEFGPVVHEVRQLDVKFDPAPVRWSRLYMSNEWSAICTEYKANAFGASFVLANVSRDNAVINGEESLPFGNVAPGNRVLTVIGNVLVSSEDQTITANNTAAIKKNGIVPAEFSSTWIQSKSAAQSLANWVKAHWGTGSDILQVQVFGNPLLEPTDVVAIEWAEKFMTAATHKYFITGIQTNFEQGVTTTLTLRRIV